MVLKIRDIEGDWFYKVEILKEIGDSVKLLAILHNSAQFFAIPRNGIRIGTP